MFTRLSTSQIVSQIVHHCANITITTNILYAGWSRSHTPPYLPPFLRTHPHLITTRQEQHNIFPIRWLHVLKATIKLRSSNLRSRQMDAGFSGRWLRGHPLPPLSPPTSFASRFLSTVSLRSLESSLSPTGASKTREFGDPECND